MRSLVVVTLFALALPGRAESLEDVIARVKVSVVAVGSFQSTRSPQFAFRGTGFVVGDGTLIATNAHVLPELDAQKLEVMSVVLPGIGQRAMARREARTLLVDKDHDLALLKVSGSPLPALVLAGKASPREGSSAAFTGFPIGAVLGLVPVTHRAMVSAITPVAIPSATARDLNEHVLRRLQEGSFDVLQLDATAYPGSSGSPLYDAGTGEVLGIINMVFVKGTKESILSQPSGITFAVPVGFLEDLVARSREPAVR